MVKSLQDFCLACIARDISSYNRLGNFLSLRHKEILLERICWHRLLTAGNTPSIIYNLFSHTLQRVNLSYSDQVDDKILSLLGESGCLLTSVVVHECPHVSDKGVSALSRILRKAEEIKLKELKQLTGECLKSIKSRTLTSVNLSYSSNIKDGGLVALAGNCPNIRKLNLCGLHKVSDHGLVRVAQLLAGKLEELNFRELNFVTSQSTLALAQHCRNLEIANFESCVRLDGSGLTQMAEQCKLSSLCLSFCYKVTPQACEVIVSLLRANGGLVKFEAMGLNISPLAMEMLASTTSLESLDLCGVPAMRDEMVEMITKAAGKTLVNLNISSCQLLTDQSCASIARHCKCLEVLGMRNLRAITGEDLSKFFLDKKRAENFRSIALSGTKNISSILVEQAVTHCPNLNTLTVAGVKGITDAIPEALSIHCKNLKYVSFRNCDLTDDGVCRVAVHCSQLVTIALAGIHDLTDKSVIALAENCPDLRELYISGCAKITKQAVIYLKDCAVGHVFVNHSTPNQPRGMLMAKDLDTGSYYRVDDVDFDSLYRQT